MASAWLRHTFRRGDQQQAYARLPHLAVFACHVGIERTVAYMFHTQLQQARAQHLLVEAVSRIVIPEVGIHAYRVDKVACAARLHALHVAIRRAGLRQRRRTDRKQQ